MKVEKRLGGIIRFCSYIISFLIRYNTSSKNKV